MERLEAEVLVTAWYGTTGRRDGERSGSSSASVSRGRNHGGIASTPHAPSFRRPADDLIRLARAQTPFRASRRPPSVRFGMASMPVVVVAAVPKPVLRLTGILWGSEPVALLEGVPGQEGAVVVREGESVGALRVIRVERSRVLLSGFDTTWTLTVRQPWQ